MGIFNSKKNLRTVGIEELDIRTEKQQAPSVTITVGNHVSVADVAIAR